jgi:cytoskeletal protein CcmA (bactofilin family)
MAETSDTSTVIGSDTHIKGEMSFDNSARILGKFEGTINAKGKLHVADGASCKAQVQAGAVVVDGQVEGNISANDSIHLNAKSKLIGDLVASKLVVAEGAALNGHINVGPDAAKGAGISRPGGAPSGSAPSTPGGSTGGSSGGAPGGSKPAGR